MARLGRAYPVGAIIKRQVFSAAAAQAARRRNAMIFCWLPPLLLLGLRRWTG